MFKIGLSMFEIKQRGSTIRREILGGLTTFMAMSYILFVQPVVLSNAGMDPGAVFMATCIASGVACILMGVLANYPIALAPGMGENFFFVTGLCGMSLAGTGIVTGTFHLGGWAQALALTAVVGVVFLALSLVGFRARILNAIPDALKSGIAAGIGLFIAFIGFRWGNIIEPAEGTLVALAKISGNYVAGLTLLGLAVTLTLMAFRVRGALLIGILATTAAAWGVGRLWKIETIVFSAEKLKQGGLEETLGAAVWGLKDLSEQIGQNWQYCLNVMMLGFILLFMDLFDTVGTLVGVSSRAGLMKDGRLPRAERALAADAAGTVFGALVGTSTVTSYIESVTGVAAGARTGLAAIVAGVCMLAALFAQPVVGIVGQGVRLGGGRYWPMIAPALILVGAMMIRVIREVKWDDVTEALPAFLTMVTMPFAHSIVAGIAIGFVSYAFGKLVTGRVKECPIVVYIFAALFVFQYAVGLQYGVRLQG